MRLQILLISPAILVSVSLLAPPSDHWAPLLKVLNQEPEKAQALVDPFTHPLGEDLQKTYEKEIHSVDKLWREQAKKYKPKMERPAALRERMNRFYFESLSSRNKATTAALDKASESHKKAAKNYRKVAEAVLGEVSRSPVAKLESVQHYDATGQIGFCFGRALFIHFLLLKRGVPQRDIARIFMLGQLVVKGQNWNFHTAILLRDSAQGFLVLDPLQEKLLSYGDWMAANAPFEVKAPLSRARFYVTDPRKFLPSFGKYDRKQLDNPVLRPYFNRLAEEMKRVR